MSLMSKFSSDWGRNLILLYLKQVYLVHDFIMKLSRWSEELREIGLMIGYYEFHFGHSRILQKPIRI